MEFQVIALDLSSLVILFYSPSTRNLHIMSEISHRYIKYKYLYFIRYSLCAQTALRCACQRKMVLQCRLYTSSAESCGSASLQVLLLPVIQVHNYLFSLMLLAARKRMQEVKGNNCRWHPASTSMWYCAVTVFKWRVKQTWCKLFLESGQH